MNLEHEKLETFLEENICIQYSHRLNNDVIETLFKKDKAFKETIKYSPILLNLFSCDVSEMN